MYNDSDIFALMGMMTVFFFFGVASYVAMGIAYYKLAEKANVNNKWMAFVPILNNVLFLKIIKWNPWHVLWYFVPVVTFFSTLLASGLSMAAMGSDPSPAVFASMGLGIFLTVVSFIGLFVLSIVWFVKFFQAFGMSGAWVLILFVPYINGIGIYVLLLYMAFSKQVQYKLNTCESY